MFVEQAMLLPDPLFDALEFVPAHLFEPRYQRPVYGNRTLTERALFDAQAVQKIAIDTRYAFFSLLEVWHTRPIVPAEHLFKGTMWGC